MLWWKNNGWALWESRVTSDNLYIYIFIHVIYFGISLQVKIIHIWTDILSWLRPLRPYFLVFMTFYVSICKISIFLLNQITSKFMYIAQYHVKHVSLSGLANNQITGKKWKDKIHKCKIQIEINWIKIQEKTIQIQLNNNIKYHKM